MNSFSTDIIETWFSGFERLGKTVSALFSQVDGSRC